MSTRAAIYCRISDDREGAGLGVARQEADCRTLAERHGWEVAQVYVDNDVSAYDRRRKRQQWTALLEALAAGQYDAVIAWHPDRLYRQTRDLLALIDLCDRDRVKVATVTAGEVDLSTATGRAVAKTVAAWNEHESEHKAERNRAKARELADAGKIGNGGPRPFGYQADRITPAPLEADLLRQAYLDLLDGRGLRTIATAWNAQGVTTTTGRPWTMQALRFTLLRARNIGWREHHGRLAAPAVWPGIVERDVWEQVRVMLTSPDRPGAGRRMYTRRYLLTGVLHCGVCGTPLKPSRNADLQRFACRPDPGRPACGKILVRYSPLEEHVVALLLARIEHDVDLTPDEHDPAEPLRERIATLEGNLRNLAAAYADGGDFLEMRTLGDRWRGEITDLRRQIGETTVRQRLADPQGIGEQWPTLDLEQRRAIVDVLLDRVDVGPARRGVNSFEPERLTVVWR